jgi:phage recombination protein Bet
MSEVAKLPTTGDHGDWTDSQKALMEFAGLVKKVGDGFAYAPRATIEAFAQTVQRTQLDPIARQIYCIERGGRYTIQVSIDGARLVAQRSGQYEGQTATEWTSDGVTWLDVWLSKEPPQASRVGVWRAGFREPVYAVATWDGFAPKSKSTGDVTGLWATGLGSHMLAKCAEMLALRKAFPMELSGLYVPEEMDQSAPNKPFTGDVDSNSAPSKANKGTDWVVEMNKITDKADLAKLYERIRDHGEMTANLSKKLQDYAGTLTIDSRETATQVSEDVVDAEIVETETPVTEPVSDLLTEILSETTETKKK